MEVPFGSVPIMSKHHITHLIDGITDSVVYPWE